MICALALHTHISPRELAELDAEMLVTLTNLALEAAKD